MIAPITTKLRIRGKRRRMRSSTTMTHMYRNHREWPIPQITQAERARARRAGLAPPPCYELPPVATARSRALLCFERHAFKFQNAGLEFPIGLIRAAIVGSQPTSCGYRSAANRWLMMIGPEAAPHFLDVEQDCHMNQHRAGLFGERLDCDRPR
jgi:hypothetical protein